MGTRDSTGSIGELDTNTWIARLSLVHIRKSKMSFRLGRCWMRLVCPNCDAEYEVDAAAIPQVGRDVQCSNCGHAWFQIHPDAEAETAADLMDAARVADDQTVAAVAKPSDAPGSAMVSAPDSAMGRAPDSAPGRAPDRPDRITPAAGAPIIPTPSRSLDETVLAVLREEAERETAARRAEAAARGRAAGIETQTELPLAQDQSSMAATVRRIARLRGKDAEPAAPPPPPKSRRDMLPAIEDINSTLRATSDRRSDADNAIFDSMGEGRTEARGFRSGFLILVLLAVIIVVLYVAASMFGAKVPALAGIAAGYVKTLDAARVWLDVELKALIGALRGLAGGQGG